MFLQMHQKPWVGKVPSPREVSALSRRMDGVLSRTPVLEVDRRSSKGMKHGEGKLYLKLESLQRSGSCKIRAVAAQVLSQPKEQWQKGWVAVGGVNYVRAAAAYAELVNIRATLICVSDAQEDECLDCFSLGKTYYEKEAEAGLNRAHTLALADGSLLLSEYENSEVKVSGYATIGFELLLQSKNLHAVLVPMVSGGMLAGVGAFIKQMKPECAVYGVALSHNMGAFRGAARGCSKGGENFNAMCINRFVDELLIVTPQTVREAQKWSYNNWRLALEQSGALAVAGLIEVFGSQRCNDNVGVVLSGGNVSIDSLANCMREGTA